MRSSVPIICAFLATALAQPSFTYEYHPGFIGAGNDVEKPQNMTIAEAKAHCASLSRCRAICFKGSNTTTGKVNSYFKSSAGVAGDKSWTTFLKVGNPRPPAKTLEVGNSKLILSLREDYFTVHSLNTSVGDLKYSFARPLDVSSVLPLCAHIGDVTIRTQAPTADADPLSWNTYSSINIAAKAKAIDCSGNCLAAQDITDMLAASTEEAGSAFPLKVIRSYETSADGNALVLAFNISATSAVRVGGLGFALPENPGHPPAGIEQTVWNDPHIGGEHGFVEFVRVVDDEATLLVTPENGYAKTTPFEAWRPMLEDLGNGDSYEWTVASAAWAAEWALNYQTPFVNMSDTVHGTPDMFPHAETPWPSTDGHTGVPLIEAAKVSNNTHTLPFARAALENGAPPPPRASP
jgi:hypothetical protein